MGGNMLLFIFVSTKNEFEFRYHILIKGE